MMAIVTGPPGSGKSYYTVRKIVEALEAGKYVLTNVEMVPGWQRRIGRGNLVRRLMPGRVSGITDDVQARTMVTGSLDEIMRVRLPGTGEARGVCVLDEAHNWMNSRNWRDDDRANIIRWFSQHRKLGWDVYLVTQSAENVDRQVRSLFEYHVTLRNLRRFRVMGIPLFPVNLFVAIWQWHAAKGAIVKREAYRLTWIASLYDTMATSHGLDDDDDAAAPILYPPRPDRRARRRARALPARQRRRAAPPAPPARPARRASGPPQLLPAGVTARFDPATGRPLVPSERPSRVGSVPPARIPPPPL